MLLLPLPAAAVWRVVPVCPKGPVVCCLQVLLLQACEPVALAAVVGAVGAVPGAAAVVAVAAVLASVCCKPPWGVGWHLPCLA